METQVFKIFLAFVVLINPFAVLSLFLDITRTASMQERRTVALISSLTVFIAIGFFTLAGQSVLQVLGITLGSFRVAGGLLVLLIAISMVNGAGNPAKSPNPTTATALAHEPKVFNGAAMAVVPLSIPMIIGPGGISTVIIYAADAKGAKGLFAIIAAGLIISVANYLILMGANKVSKFLGDTGLNILNRIMGMLLAAVAVEIIVAGLKEIFPKLLA